MRMECERRLEGMPLNSASIVLGGGEARPQLAAPAQPGATVIHLKSEKSSAQDVGLHINTTFAITSSKKIKILFILSFLMSLMCMILSSSVAFYYWNEMLSMRRQLEVIREHLIVQGYQGVNNIFEETAKESALLSGQMGPKPLAGLDGFYRKNKELKPSTDARRYYVDDLGQDLHFTDSKKKHLSKQQENNDISSFQKDELLVAHFIGEGVERILGTESLIGPLVMDDVVSSEGSSEKIVLTDSNYVVIKEEGVYLVYAQVVYLTHTPSTYYIWAKMSPEEPRLLATCSTGDDSTDRELSRSQLSCSTMTVARLRKGDVVNLSQRERNVTLWLIPGYTFFGLVKLGS